MYNNIYHIGGYTGKLSWNLGKKWGADACSLKLPKEENNDDEFNARPFGPILKPLPIPSFRAVPTTMATAAAMATATTAIN